MTLRTRLAALLCALLAGLGTPAVAAAQLGGGGGQLGAPEPQPVVPEPVDPNDDGWEGWQTALVTLAGVVLVVGIGFAILGDARRAAPGAEEELRHRDAMLLDDQGERLHHKGGKSRSRAAQKRARQSRKKNRAKR